MLWLNETNHQNPKIHKTPKGKNPTTPEYSEEKQLEATLNDKRQRKMKGQLIFFD